MTMTVTDYQSLAEFRHQVRRFLRFSELTARSGGLEPRQYQLLLAIKGLPAAARPRVAELAERLQIQHHSAVELANRLETGGYVQRHRADGDRREVLLSLTPKGDRVLNHMALRHREELRVLGPALLEALQRVLEGAAVTKTARSTRRRE
jgi:DNA-binding MarR family transcriptional regulator